MDDLRFFLRAGGEKKVGVRFPANQWRIRRRAGLSPID